MHRHAQIWHVVHGIVEATQVHRTLKVLAGLSNGSCANRASQNLGMHASCATARTAFYVSADVDRGVKPHLHAKQWIDEGLNGLDFQAHLQTLLCQIRGSSHSALRTVYDLWLRAGCQFHQEVCATLVAQ
jgi:hypothetical protein